MKQYDEPKTAALTKGVTCNSKDDEKKSQKDNRCQKEESVEAETDGRFNTNWFDEEKHVSVPASAIYANANLVKFKQEQQKHRELLNIYKDSVIHGSPTLDEWYYHFGPDSHIDKDHRNKDQVVSKFLEGVKRLNQNTNGTMPSDENKKYSDDLSSSTFLRVNQLWVWTIANKWLITATSVVFDDEHDTLVEGILNQFRKQTASGGSSSQPKSAADMSKLVVDYCIGSYERQPKPVGLISIGKVFSQYINQLGRQETSLFDEFRQQTQGWRQKEALSRISPEASSYDEIRGKAEELFRCIKGVRNELNILRSVAQYQKTVQRKLFDSEFKDADLSAETVLNDIKEMVVLAERIDLAQSEITNYQATLATAQGKMIRAFTFAAVIFVNDDDLVFVSIAFSLVLGLVAFFWYKITEHLPRIRIFEDADLPRAPKDYHIAKPKKKEDPMSPVEPPTVMAEGLYHRLRGHSKAKQQSHV
ncbi:unnamed protein product [Clonostachys byssicola]|uniref:Uncharacterized protein n=1 Tax=Clonostachys byssicola TaxID=160290 RepID=A0A9N9Y2K2_9HYPO|nr:unnamed protein product [Clonostachys byssicola]